MICFGGATIRTRAAILFFNLECPPSLILDQNLNSHAREAGSQHATQAAETAELQSRLEAVTRENASLLVS